MLLFLVAFASAVSLASAGFKSDILSKHNGYRSDHGVDDLAWKGKIKKFAASHCEGLAAAGTFAHSDSATLSAKNYGENIYSSWGYSSSDAGVNAADSWYSEEPDYDYDTNSYQSAAGHFTAMVWKSSTKLGCAKAVNGTRTVVCCNYYPAGNSGQYTSNVFDKTEE